MAVRVVSCDPVLEPQDICCAEIVQKVFFKLLTCQSRITGLHRTQQTFLGGNESAAAVYIDAAAFDDNAPPPKLRMPLFPFEFLSKAVIPGVIFFPVIVLGPGIEMPVRNRTFGLFVAHEDRPEIANPSAVGGNVEGIDG